MADAAIAQGRIDFIPSRFTRIPHLIESGLVPVDIAIVQVTAPNEAGYCSLGVTLYVAREAISQAEIAVGEINPRIPHTFGDTYIPASEFDLLVCSEFSPPLFDRWSFDESLDRVATNVAALIEDGGCLAFCMPPPTSSVTASRSPVPGHQAVG